MTPKLYQRKPVPMQVRFATEIGQVQTFGGPAACLPGDAIVTGTRGEQWPVQRQRFESTYKCISPLPMGQDGTYQRKPETVFACQLKEATVVTLSDGRGMLSGKANDWLLQNKKGMKWLVYADVFHDLYELADHPTTEDEVEDLPTPR